MNNLASITGVDSNGWALAEPSKKIQSIWQGTFNDCDGKERGNYTDVVIEEVDERCSPESAVITSGSLIVSKPNGQKSIVMYSNLAASRYPADQCEISN